MTHNQPAVRPTAKPVETLTAAAPAPTLTGADSVPVAPWTPESVWGGALDFTSSAEARQSSTRFQRAASEPCIETRRYGPGRASLGFAGDTSYSAILDEGLRQNADLLPIEAAETTAEADTPISAEHISRGCAALAFLEDRIVVDELLSRWFDFSAGTVVRPIAHEWINGIWTDHGEVLASQKPERLRRLSEAIWQNTRSSLDFGPQTTARQWARSATGPGLRWEVIGLLAVLAGLSAKTFEDQNFAVTSDQKERLAFAKKMAAVGKACLEFCQECETIDDLYMCLALEFVYITAAIRGDSHFASYRATGELCDALIARGFHQKAAATNDKVPFFLAELRRRAFLFAYLTELGGASFLGRPARLSYHYSTVDLPLDLTGEQLVLEGEELAAALATLDEKGFDKTGRPADRITWLRAYLPFAHQRENILDLALGQYSRDEILARAEAIRTAIDAAWEQLPASIAQKWEETLSKLDRPLDTLLCSAVRQSVRATELLLQRILIRRTGARPDKLIAAALDIFRDTLAITQRQEIARVSQSDVTGMLVIHGLRSAAIISIELLRQEQMPSYPNPPLLPRSQTIQDLAVFVSRLGNIDPTDGSFAVCEQVRRVISKILERILAPPAARGESSASGVLNASQSPRPVGNEELAHLGDAVWPGLQAQATFEPGQSQLPEFTATDLGLGFEMPSEVDFMQWLDGLDPIA